MPDEKRFVPDFQLVVDGKAADPDLKGAVLGIRVTDDMDKASRFWVHLSDTARKWTRQGRFKPGTAIEIRLGYQGDLKSVCKGEVSGLEVVLDADAPTRLIVSGVDKGHAFDQGTVTRTYKDVKDSDLAREIAQRHGLSAEVDDSKVVHDYVIQNNLSDYDFLMQRAAMAGFRVYVDDRKLLFRKPKLGDAPAATLTWRENIGRFVQEVNTFEQVSRITTSGWDAKQAKQATGPGKGGDEYGKQGGTVTGAQLVKQMFGEIEQVTTVASGEKNLLEALAKSEFNRRAGVFVHAEARVTGDPAIRAGAVVEVEKAGKRVDGEYYVVSTDHVFFVDTGYATELRAKRYTIRKGSSPVKDVAKIAREVQAAAKKAEEIAGKIEKAGAFTLEAAREAAKRASQALEAARQVWADVKAALDEVKDGAADVAQTALRIVGRRLAELDHYVAKARSKVDEAAQEAKAARQAARDAFSKAHEAAAQVTEIAAKAIGHARDAFDAVRAAALDGEHTSGDGLSADVEGHKKSALAAAEAAVSTGKTGMGLAHAAIAKGKNAIELCGASAAETAKPLIEGLGADQGKVAEAVQASGDSAEKSIGSAVAAGAQHALDAAKESIREAQDAIGKAKQALQDAAGTIGKNVGEKLKAVVGQARSIVDGASKTVDACKAKLDECRKRIEEAVDRCGGKWIEAGLYLKEHGGKAFDAGKSCYGHIRKGVSLLKEKKWAEADAHVDPAEKDFGTVKSEAQLCSDKLEEVEKDLPDGVRQALRSTVARIRAALPHGGSALSRFVEAVRAKAEPLVEEATRACEAGEAEHDALSRAHGEEKDGLEGAVKRFGAQVKERYGKLHDLGSRMQGHLEKAIRRGSVSIDESAGIALPQARGAIDEVVAACGESKAAYEEAGKARAGVDELVSAIPEIRDHVQSAFGHLAQALDGAEAASEESSKTLSAHEKEIEAEAARMTAPAGDAVKRAQAALEETKKRMERNKALFRAMPARKGAADAIDAAIAAAQSAAGAAESAKDSAAQARGTALGACKVPGDGHVKDEALAAIAELEKAAKKAEETAEKAQEAVDSAAQGDGAGAKRNASDARAAQAASASTAAAASASAQKSQSAASQAQATKQSPKERPPGSAGAPSGSAPAAGAKSAPSSGSSSAAADAPDTAGVAPRPPAVEDRGRGAGFQAPSGTAAAAEEPQGFVEAASSAAAKPGETASAESTSVVPDVEAGVGSGAAASGVVLSVASAVESTKDDAAKAKDDAASKKEEIAAQRGEGNSADIEG